jgi:hypothetical protein
LRLLHNKAGWIVKGVKEPGFQPKARGNDVRELLRINLLARLKKNALDASVTHIQVLTNEI